MKVRTCLCFNCCNEFKSSRNDIYCSVTCREEAKSTDHDQDVRLYIKNLEKQDRELCKRYGVPVSWAT